MFCKECGSQLEEGAIFCQCCGARVVSYRETETPDFSARDGESLGAVVEETKNRSRRRAPLVLLVTLAVALIAGVAYAVCATFGIGGNAHDDEAPSTFEGEAEYSVKEVTIDVSTPTDPLAKSVGRISRTWTYPLIESSVRDAGVEEVNNRIAEVVSSSKNRVESTPTGKDTSVCDGRVIVVTALRDDKVFVEDSYYYQGWGPHGFCTNSGVAFDLKTGEQVSLEIACDIDMNELTSATVDALKLWESNQDDTNHPSRSAGARIASYRNHDRAYVVDVFEEALPFAVDEKGILYLPEDYEMKPVYTGGAIYVKVFSDEDAALVGTLKDETPEKRLYSQYK